MGTFNEFLINLNMEYTREELIELCKDSVVPFSKWKSNYTYNNQILLYSAYAGLMGGVDYTYETDNEYFIKVMFKHPNEHQLREIEYVYWTEPSDCISEFIKHYLQTNKITKLPKELIGKDIDWKDKAHPKAVNIPTRKTIRESNGNDWS